MLTSVQTSFFFVENSYKTSFPSFRLALFFKVNTHPSARVILSMQLWSFQILSKNIKASHTNKIQAPKNDIQNPCHLTLYQLSIKCLLNPSNNRFPYDSKSEYITFACSHSGSLRLFPQSQLQPWCWAVTQRSFLISMLHDLGSTCSGWTIVTKDLFCFVLFLSFKMSKLRGQCDHPEGPRSEKPGPPAGNPELPPGSAIHVFYDFWGMSLGLSSSSMKWG